MKWKYRYSRLLAGFLIAMACGFCHAEFAVPAEGPVAFRRDRVPLDADTMTLLAQHLTTLARTQPIATPAERRTVAQLLALAQALDPGNAASRGLMTACRNGRHTPLEDPADRSRSLAKIRQLADWLKLPQAADGGQELAACLQDVATASDPGKPTVALTEAGAWTGWVPEIAAYDARPKVTDEHPTSSFQPTVEPATPTVRLPQAAVATLAWKKSGERESAGWFQVPTSLSMDASLAEDQSAGLSLRVGPRDSPLEEPTRMIAILLGKYHGDLPRGLRIRINCEELSKSPSASSPLLSSAAAAVLASAAITGREPDAFVLGRVDESGALTLPRTFWDQLLALGPGHGKRLVLPASAAELLPSLLAIGKPGIFMDYEVLLARDFRHLLDLTAKEPPAAVAVASAKFRVIRDRMGNEDVRAYVANSFVRQRFGELSQEASYHASAAMLLIQGSGQRPTLVSRAVLTAELIRASNALSWILKTQDRDLEAWEQDHLGKTQDAYRKRLDELAAFAAKTDQDLMESARVLQQPLRDIERAQRGRGEYYLKMEAMWRAREVFSRQFTALEKSLADEARKLTNE